MRNRSLLLNLAALVVVVAGVKAAEPLLVPFLLASFVTILCAPPMFWLTAKGLPEWLAVVLVFIGVLAGGLFLVAFIGGSINDFSRHLPEYQSRLQEQTAGLVEWLVGKGINVSQELVLERFDPSIAMNLAGSLLSGLSGALANLFLIILTVVFLLLETSGLPRKLHRALGDATTSLNDFERFINGVKNYLTIKTSMSLLTGVAVAGLLAGLGVDYPLLWGLLAFLLNFVPNIGSFIAAIPAVLLALIQHGPLLAAWVVVGYVGINLIVDNVLTTRYMGKGLGLSNLVVFLSLVVWGWVLGPVGMLLSVPLTMIVKIALESAESTRWIAVLLGPDLPEMLPNMPEPKNQEAGKD